MLQKRNDRPATTIPDQSARDRLALAFATAGAILIVSTMVFVAWGSGALAQSRPDAEALTGEQRAACKADFVRLCPGVRPGGGRVRECFVANFQKLSQPCQEAVAAHEAKD